MDDALIEHDTALEESEADDDKLAEIHERAMRRFDEINTATKDCRAQSLAARRFATVPGAQWEGEWGEQWENAIKVEVNKVARGVEKIESDYRENRIVPDFRPDGGRADQQTADMLDGLHRADSYFYKSQQARDNAFFEAVAGGFGAYRLTDELEDEGDKNNDNRRVNPASIVTDADQSVFFDLNARLYDKADARFGFIRVAMTPDAFEDEYDTKTLTDFPDVPWSIRDWFNPETVAIAEYYEREDVDDKLWVATHRLSDEEVRLWASDLEEGQLAQLRKDGWELKSQRRKRCRVHKYILSGSEVLEDRGLIAGSCIPIVPVYGKRTFVDGVERWIGYVQPKMDAQRLYNSTVSKLAETNALAPNEVPIFAAEQMPPELAQLWAEGAIKRHPYRLVEVLRNEDGTVAAAGPLGMLNAPQTPPVTAALLQISNQDLTEDQQDGADQVKANTSAEAMDVAATRIDARSGPYLDNMRMSVQREGEIYLSKAAEIYAEEGRTVSTMSEDGDDGRATLKAQYTDRNTGQNRVINDLESARYKVIASVTEATATRRDKTVRSMLMTAEVAVQAQDMELAQAAILTATLNQDGEGIDDFQKWARKKALGIGLVTPNEEEQHEMDQAAQSQQQAAPSPTDQALNAQAADFAASAAKKQAETVLTGAKVDNTKADTAAKLASIGRAHAETIAGITHQGAETGARIDTHRSAAMNNLASAHQRMKPPEKAN
jgi:hypothetical protein